LEHVHAALQTLKKVTKFLLFQIEKQNGAHVCDAGEADEVREDANQRDEQFLTTTQQLGVFVHHCCDETFHCTELQLNQYKVVRFYYKISTLLLKKGFLISHLTVQTDE